MKSSVAENLGAQLRRTRKSRDLTQPALAARLGRDRARISELERDLIQGRLGRDRLALLLEICDALDLSPVLVPAERLAAVQALLAPTGPKEDAARPDGTAFDDVFIDLADGRSVMVRAAVLGVHLLDPAGRPRRVGILSRDGEGATAFIVDEAYLRDPARPVLSLGWQVPGDEAATRGRLAARGDKIGLNGHLPPWFAGLLPEGALRDLVLAEMGPGRHDQFDLLTRLGGDLPGAVLVTSETAPPETAGPLHLERFAGLDLPQPEGLVKFSLAGVQLKFSAAPAGARLTVPARGGEGRAILKVPTARYPGLPEAEFAAMTLCRMIGVTTAGCRLVPVGEIDGLSAGLLSGGAMALAVDRFDRPGEGERLHMEDAGQVVGAVGERKYTMATYETILNMIRRFSTDWRADVLEGIRRIVADVLIGNGDNHLKNWSFLFPGGGAVRLSPAYDIVPTVLFAPDDQLALRFVGTHGFSAVTLRRFRRVADFLGLDPDWIEREVRDTVLMALDLWPEALRAHLGAPQADRLIARLETLALVEEARG